MNVTRRLVTVFCADVAGYSRLTGTDEEGTHRRVMAMLDDVTAAIAGAGGKVLRYAGDAILATFPSVVLAVNTAATIQAELARRNADLAPDERVTLRIGINLGDVIEDRGEVFGEGVNLAARLEAAAAPGGICLSAAAHDQIAGKATVAFADGGEQRFKNIARPVRVFHWSSDAAAPTAGAADGLQRAERPSIAVLPFTDMSGEAGQEYFADGITEDIITELSRFRSLRVIARNSSFAFKGRAVDIREVGGRLGVAYVLEGSVRKAGSRVRVTAQLIDADSGSHLWAERYDRDMADIFEVQDELTRSIVATVPGRLESALAERLRGRTPTDLNAWDCLIRAKLLHHHGGREDNAEAIALLDTAIARDPEFVAAYGWKVCVLSQAWSRGYRALSQADYDDAEELIRRGLALDPNDLECVRIMCEYHMERREFADARRFSEKALRLNPNDPRILAQRGELLAWTGEAEEAVGWIEHAAALDPFGADGLAHLLGLALFGARRYAEAIDAFRRVPARRPWHSACLAACHALLGQPREAAAAAEELRAARPDVAAEAFVAGLVYERDEDRQHLLEGLRKAGLG